MFCSQCGAPMGDDDKFCARCGAPNSAAGYSASGVGTMPVNPPMTSPAQLNQRPKERGCLAQAFHDMTKLPGVFKRVCQISFLPALIGIVSVVLLFIPVIGGILCAIGLLLAYIAGVCGSGYGIEWGRDLSTGAEGGMERPLLRSTSFGMGIFSAIISGVLSFVAAIPVIGVVLSVIEGIVVGSVGSYYLGGSSALSSALLGSFGILVLCLIVALVLGIFFKMFGDITVMHFAVVGRIESAFALDKVWKAFRHDKTKLFCASVLPEFLCDLVSNIIVWILTAIFGAIAAASYAYSFHGFGFNYSRPSGIAAIISSGGVTLVVFLILVVFVSVFLNVFGTMLKHRAVGYWAQRYAPEWIDEGDDAVLAFVLPGEKGPSVALSPDSTSIPVSSSAPVPAPAPMPENPSGDASAASKTPVDGTVKSVSGSPAAETTVLPDIDPGDDNPFDE